MLSSSIFYSGYNILFGVLSLFIGLGSTFLVRGSKEFRGLMMFQLGGLCIVFLTYLAPNEHILYKIGLNYNFVAFAHMILALFTSVIWLNAATELHDEKPANREILTFYISVCLTIGLFYSFIAYSQSSVNMLNSAISLLSLTFFGIVVLHRCVFSFNLGNFLLFCSVFMLSMQFQRIICVSIGTVSDIPLVLYLGLLNIAVTSCVALLCGL